MLLLVHAFRLLTQVREDELINVAIEYLLDLSRLHAGAHILDEGVRLQDVVTDLVAPGDLALLVVKLLHLGQSLLLFDAVQLGLEQRHGIGRILVLATLGAALGGDAGRLMAETDAAFRLVLVLAAGTTAAERLPL